MTNEEAQIVIGNIPIKPEVLDDCYDITEYQEAKAMAIEALGKDIPKKPISVYGSRIKTCPNCRTMVYDADWYISLKEKYFTRRCLNCGQLFTKKCKFIGEWENEE